MTTEQMDELERLHAEHGLRQVCCLTALPALLATARRAAELERENARYREALEKALRQWQMYARLNGRTKTPMYLAGAKALLAARGD